MFKKLAELIVEISNFFNWVPLFFAFVFIIYSSFKIEILCRLVKVYENQKICENRLQRYKLKQMFQNNYLLLFVFVFILLSSLVSVEPSNDLIGLAHDDFPFCLSDFVLLGVDGLDFLKWRSQRSTSGSRGKNIFG